MSTTTAAAMMAATAFSSVLGRCGDLSHLDDDDRATILAVIDAIATKAKLRLITSGAS